MTNLAVLHIKLVIKNTKYTESPPCPKLFQERVSKGLTSFRAVQVLVDGGFLKFPLQDCPDSIWRQYFRHGKYEAAW